MKLTKKNKKKRREKERKIRSSRSREDKRVWGWVASKLWELKESSEDLVDEVDRELIDDWEGTGCQSLC